MEKKLIVVLGPTASGKSELAVKLAKKFNGEIISADSRQVYRGMDIGTGKITPDIKNSLNFSTGQVKKKYIFSHKGIPHYCIDVTLPKRKFTVVQYRKLALKAINKIFKKNMVPILCGGTGFYIQAVIDGLLIPQVRPDWKLRKNLEKKSVKELYKILKKLDPKRVKAIEKKNPRRLIRAIEIAKKIGHVPSLKKESLPYPVLLIGIKKEKRELSSLIRKRLLKRLKGGMIAEVKKLKNLPAGRGLSWKRLEEFGLEYRYIAQYLQEKISYKEMIERIQQKSEQFARRQMTWWKTDKRIKWIKKQKEAEKLIKAFLAI